MENPNKYMVKGIRHAFSICRQIFLWWWTHLGQVCGVQVEKVKGSRDYLCQGKCHLHENEVIW